ncbi:transmembrane emp24 domain-containing protein 5-like [Mercenaria mercenaria]|uniref:transmembrane emp24 domain-containing protein 5-like n=1 Tax=Mercenaria mercenaria TaxID=6596 RepID=UPI00234F80FB|nr:transmembrane emp24 domain-containing protein 5-like [Mercenaria mercenaria]
MAKLFPIFIITTFIYTRTKCLCEKIFDRETDDFDFDGFPGASHEFKFELVAGKEECFYQNLVAGGTLHISFQVLRGGDGIIGLTLKKPEQNPLDILHSIEPSTRGYFQYGPTTEDGDYAICVDNTMSRMTSKLVYMFILTHIEEQYTWYMDLKKDNRLTEENVTTSMQNVQESLAAAFIYQAERRMHVVRDWYLVTSNNTYIQTWSMCQCCIVIVCSIVQVFFVRRLFRGYNVKPNSKP